jgi:RNA polymerase sigma factor (sigma-70 family)
MATSAATVMRAVIRMDRSAVSDRELLRRFAEAGDQDAFAALVRRHAGMVLGVCRRALPTMQDAEDACQATFLVLLRQAGARHWQSSIASYLYVTARRVAGNARLAARRRAKREERAAVPEQRATVDQITGRELLEILDEELGRLPVIYREPLVLCYLEGLTRDEAARQLGIPSATLKSQLERGRKKLGDALTRRGCALGAGLLAIAVTSPARASSPRLVEAILASVSGSPPAAVAALARGSIVSALVNRVMVAALVLFAVLGVGMAAWKRPAASQPAARADAPKAAAKDSKPAPPARETVSGRVVDPAGKPLAGAELLLVGHAKTPENLGVTAADGRFSVAVPRGKRWVVLLARAPGTGIDFIDLGDAPAAGVELRLVKDHAIRGRVVDTEGRPVAGVKISVNHVRVYENNSLDSFLAAWKNREPHSGLPEGIKSIGDGDTPFPVATSGKDGRFTITGVGNERLVGLTLRGAGIAESEVWVVNRAGFDPKPYNKAMVDRIARSPFGLAMHWLLCGPEPSVVTEAEKPIRGVVKDVDTGKACPGVKVTLSRNGKELLPIVLSATTDAQGGFEIRGARKAKAYMVEVPSDPATGHVARQARAVDTPGYAPITIDVGVKKGVVITGRVIDRATGKGLPGFVMTSVLAGNPLATDYREFDSSAFLASIKTADDGTFRVVALPGPVILMGGVDPRRAGDLAWYRYKGPVADPKHPKYFSTKKGYEGIFFGYGGAISPIQGSYCKVLVVEPGTLEIKQDVVLERASALALKVVDSDGRGVTGTWVTGLSPQDWHRPTRIAKDTCSVYQLQGKPRLVVFHDPAGKRFATVRLKGDEKEVVVVKLGPGGAVKGRLIGEDGKPLAGVAVRLYHRERVAEEMHAHIHRASLVETDADGRFRIDGVVPGVPFYLALSRGQQSFEPAAKLADPQVQPGKRLDLGDVKVKPKRQSPD